MSKVTLLAGCIAAMSIFSASAEAVTTTTTNNVTTAVPLAATFYNFDDINLDSIATLTVSTGSGVSNGTFGDAPDGGNFLALRDFFDGETLTSGVATWTLVNPASYFGFLWGTNDGPFNTVELFNGTKSLGLFEGSEFTSGGTNNFANFFAGPGESITSVVLRNIGRCCFETDNFAYITATDDTDTSAVPVPAALPLLATGLGALGIAGWRRQKKNTGK